MRLKTISPILLLLAGSVAILPAATVAPQEPERPLQPFLVELLGQERGNWKFKTPFGASLALEKPVKLHAKGRGKAEKLGILLENPEFPGDRSRAEWKEILPASSEDVFQVDEPNVSMKVTLESVPGGIVAEASSIRLGAAKLSDWNFVGMYLRMEGEWRPLELDGDNGEFKLLTDRVGSVFSDGEDLVVTLDDWSGKDRAGTLTVHNYADGKELLQNKISMTGKRTRIRLEINQFGVFIVTINTAEKKAVLRITRIPRRKKLDPENSVIGINIFQQQHWYYSYQLPLFAAAGVRWVRPWLFWENSWLFQEPEKGKWDTRELDATLRRLEKYGQKYEYILYNFPSWLVAEKSTQYTQLSEAQTAQWLDYIAKIVKHCAEYVTDFEIWNEPDLLANYNRKFSAEFFSDFTRKTAAAVREANPRARVHILSHSTEREWLRKVGDSGIARHGDVITLHSYASVRRFFQTESIRQRILDCGGFLGIPQYFNEIGFDGYDGCPEYAKAFPNTSERDQARNLVLNTVQTLHVAGPKGKMFYFCSLDPRDSTDPEGRTWDSAFGLLYLGLQPKLGFAALAALAQMIDGHPVLGYVEVRDKIHFTAFSDERAIVWSDAPSGSVQAMKLGCAENEMLKVYDLYGNPVDSGKAAELMLDLSDGPLYVCGSSALGKTAAAFREKWIGDRKKIAEAEHQVGRTEKVSMQRNGVSEISFHIPDGSTVKVSSPRSLELKAESCVADGRCTVKLRAGSVPGAGTVTCKVTLPNADLPQVDRSFPVMIERLALIEDGKFEQGSLAEFTLAGTESIDPESRAMRINGPFKSRTHLYSKLDLSTSRPLHFSVRLKGKLSATAKVSFNVSFFENGQWKGTWTCARLRENTIGSAGFNKYIREIPADISQWTPLQSILPANVLKSQTARAIFFIDVRGGLAGDYILIDDLELYQ